MGTGGTFDIILVGASQLSRKVDSVLRCPVLGSILLLYCTVHADVFCRTLFLFHLLFFAFGIWRYGIEKVTVGIIMKLELVPSTNAQKDSSTKGPLLELSSHWKWWHTTRLMHVQALNG
jgi:hypothetical protein